MSITTPAIEKNKILHHGKIYHLSNLRALSCFCIVILHTCLLAVRQFQPSFPLHVASSIIRNLVMWAVPMFVMVSGTLLLDPGHDVTLKKIFLKYIPKMLLALVLCTIAFEFYDVMTGEVTGVNIALDIIRRILTGDGWLHMWYLYLMVALYVMLPFYRMAAKNIDKEGPYLLLIYVVFQSVLPLIQTLTGQAAGFYICVATIFPFYFFAGYLISTGKVKIKRSICLALTVLCLAFIIGLTVVSVQQKSSTLGSLLGNYSFPPVLVLSICLFQMVNPTEKANPFLLAIDRCSFGIYLIHVPIIKMIYRIFNPYEHGGIFMLLLTAVIVMAVSYALTWVFLMILSLIRRRKL